MSEPMHVRGNDVGVVVDGMSDVEYHALPSLSASGAKLLLAPSCPALYRHAMDNARKEKPAWDFGHVAHSLILGVGQEIDVVDADDWRTADAKAKRKEAHAAGRVPILRDVYATAQEMAAAVRAHPLAGALFHPDYGQAEQSIFWHDETHDIDRRARLDWLTETGANRALIVDLKTTVSANPASIAKSVYDYRYFMQDPFYRDGVIAAGLSDDPGFVFVFVEKEPPFLVTVVELDHAAVRAGRDRNDQAMQVFAECTATGVWPSYSSEIELVRLPYWATKENA